MSDGDRPTLPVLGYTRPPAFGWREDGDDLVLVLPPRPRWEVLADRGSSLLAATTFMLVLCGLVVASARSAGRGASAALQATLSGFGLLAIGIWVMVVMRFIADARAVPTAATVRVAAGALSIDGATGWGDGGRQWAPGAVAGLRLDLVRRLGGRLPHARLQVVGQAGTVVAFALPWPPGEPAEPHEARLREAVGLPPRAHTDDRVR